jgi:tetratricopeptide (TPR) repeat protein
MYIVATALFLLALLTKTVTATLPAALLVVFWWRRGRLSWRRDVVPLLPWFALGAAGGLFTAHFERELIGAQGADFSLGALDRGLLAGRVFWFYLSKLLWPANLVFIYPRWTVDAAHLVQWLYPVSAVALVAVLGVAAVRATGVTRDRARAVLAALLLFGGTLFPVLGFFNVFPFLYSYVADHFQYLAALPIYAIVAYSAAAWIRGRGRPEVGPHPQTLAVAAVAIVLGALGVLTWRQARLYRDPVTLYEATLARNPTCWMAHNNLAIEFAAAGRVAEAVPHVEAAVRLKPDFAPAENNLGDDLVRLGRVTEAIPHFERALRLQPNYAVAHRNLGMALAMSNRVNDAVAHFMRAVQIDPAYAEAELDLAVALDQTRQFAAARPHFERAIALAPSSIDSRLAYAEALATHGDLDAAIRHYRAAVELAPASTEAQQGLATALRRAGRTE